MVPGRGPAKHPERQIMPNAMHTPVCLLLYRRPALTRQVFAAVRQARPRQLFLVADGPNNAAEADLCRQARAIAEEVDWPCEVHTNFAQENMGLRARVSSGLTWVFEQVEEAIILEDDCLPHPGFFSWCCQLLERYRDDARVFLVTGDNSVGIRPGHGHSYAFCRHALIWGWATWKRAWRHYDDTMADWPHLRESGWLGQLFADPAAVAHWTAKFDDGHARFNSWARAWMFACFKAQGLCAVPGVNLVSNIGFGQEATHTKGLADGRSAAPAGAIRLPLVHPPRVMADPAVERTLERRLFSGAGQPRHLDVTDAVRSLTALRRDNPWNAASHLESLATRLPGNPAVAMLDAACLARQGCWNAARDRVKNVPDCVDIPEAPAASGKPGQQDRLEIIRALGLAAPCGAPLVRLGGDSRGYGAWVAAADVLRPGAVCYLAGAGEDITFDCALAATHGCQVHIFDPTPRAIAHFQGVGDWLHAGADAADPVFGKYAGLTSDAFRRLRYHALGLFRRTATMRFYAPRTAAHVSHSILNLQATETYFEARCLRLDEAMTLLGHDRIDLLKLDIEGAEYGVLASMLALKLDVASLCIEFDEGHNPLDMHYKKRILRCAALLMDAGYTPVCMDDWNITFRKKPVARVERVRAALQALQHGEATMDPELLDSLRACCSASLQPTSSKF